MMNDFDKRTHTVKSCVFVALV